MVFLGVLPFSPHLLIDSSNMSCNNLERDVKLNQKKKINQRIKRANAQIIKSSGDVILRFFFCSVYICLSYLQGGGGGGGGLHQ